MIRNLVKVQFWTRIYIVVALNKNKNGVVSYYYHGFTDIYDLSHKNE